MTEEPRQDTTMETPDAFQAQELEDPGTPPTVEEDDDDAYGWEFHKLPLLIAAIITLIFYAFVFFYVNY